MPPGHLQSRSASGSGTSLGLAFLSNVTAASLLVGNSWSSEQTVDTISDNNGNTWASVRQQNGPSIGHGSSEAPGANAGATTVTAAYGGSSTFAEICIGEYSGCVTSNVVRDTSQNSATTPTFGTSVSSGNSTAVKDDLMIGTGATATARAKTPGAGWTERQDPGGAYLQERIAPSDGDFAASFSWSVNQDSFAQMAVYIAVLEPIVKISADPGVSALIRPKAFAPGWAR